MIGVASRNAKRAASLFESPTQRPPPIVAPEREKPGISAMRLGGADREAPAPGDLPGDARVVVGCLRLRRAAPQALGAVEHDAVEDQEERRRLRRCEHVAQRVLEQEAEHARRDRADDEQPAEPRVGVVGSIPRSRSERPSPFTMRTQSRQKKPSRTSAVARCVATRKVRKNVSFWWMFQPSRRGRITLWPRLEIGKSSLTALQQAEHDRPVRRRSARRRARESSPQPSRPRSGRSGTRRRRAREPDEHRGDAVLDVVVARARLVAGEERQRLGRLGQVDDRDDDQSDSEDRGDDDDRPAVQAHAARRYRYPRPDLAVEVLDRALEHVAQRPLVGRGERGDRGGRLADDRENPAAELDTVLRERQGSSPAGRPRRFAAPRGRAPRGGRRCRSRSRRHRTTARRASSSAAAARDRAGAGRGPARTSGRARRGSLRRGCAGPCRSRRRASGPRGRG